MPDTIAILDFGSQYAQLIARRVREAHVYCELFPWDTPPEQVLALHPKGFILSGGPASVYEPGAPSSPRIVLESRLPVLGICYGMQALTHALGGQVAASARREYGPALVETTQPNLLLSPGTQPVWMSHGDRIETPPPALLSWRAAIIPLRLPWVIYTATIMGCSSIRKCTIRPVGRNPASFRCGYLPGVPGLDTRIDHHNRHRAHPPAGGKRDGALGSQRRC